MSSFAPSTAPVRSARSLLGDRVLLIAIALAALAALLLGASREQLGLAAGIAVALVAAAGLARLVLASTSLRYAYTFVLVSLVALHIQLAAGQLEFHFGVFVVLAFLLVYLDWKVIV